MPYRISVDRTACNGYGNCVLAAPELFDVDDDNIAVVLDEAPGAGARDKADLAVAECPARAIELMSV